MALVAPSPTTSTTPNVGIVPNRAMSTNRVPRVPFNAPGPLAPNANKMMGAQAPRPVMPSNVQNRIF